MIFDINWLTASNTATWNSLSLSIHGYYEMSNAITLTCHFNWLIENVLLLLTATRNKSFWEKSCTHIPESFHPKSPSGHDAPHDFQLSNSYQSVEAGILSQLLVDRPLFTCNTISQNTHHHRARISLANSENAEQIREPGAIVFYRPSFVCGASRAFRIGKLILAQKSEMAIPRTCLEKRDGVTGRRNDYRPGPAPSTYAFQNHARRNCKVGELPSIFRRVKLALPLARFFC